ncbi:MAG: serine/threonine protein phosphatase PrpC [Verrucomicrobiales bacterium]|jgi:serine/threonine protein phosphatase PrpC
MTESQTCSACGEVGAAGAHWCEACGASVGPACVDCGAAQDQIVEEYCGQCGRKQPGERDHLSEDLGKIVAVTDRGKRHHQNEDAFAIGTSGDVLIAVVCDGVSSTDDPEVASLAAAIAARDSLVAFVESGQTDFEAALIAAVDSAQLEAASVPSVDGGEGPASTTFVATIVVRTDDGLRTWTASLGDSRAYWLHEGRVTQLTTDDSWALDQIATGVLTEEEAHADPRAQSITRWLGADAVGVDSSIQVFEHDLGGSLLSCSDGLWKYVPTEHELVDLVASLTAGAEPAGLDLAEALVAFANERGGHDNITVVIATP